jgi:glycyl-tRNA synthetase beta chain
VFDKSQRVARLVELLAKNLGVDGADAVRAATLAKCDLVTDMVGEFPELQGVMGAYYAAADGESDATVKAIREHYLPRFAGDALPTGSAGQLLAMADKIDTVAGAFVLGKKPSGKRDPFGLRRGALGLVRIIVECQLDFDLVSAIDLSVSEQPSTEGTDTAIIKDDLYDFITERMRAYYLEQGTGISAEMFEAVLTRRPHSLLDFDARMRAVCAFVGLDAAASLAAANKRIANILRRADDDGNAALDEALFTDDAERRLFADLVAARKSAAPLMVAHDYTRALTELAQLRESVDAFFDDVLVMADDVATRRNRLALLAELRSLFLEIADISCLSIG